MRNAPSLRNLVPSTSTLVGLLALVAFGCTPTFQCGTWAFSGSPTSTTGVQGSDTFPLSSAFTFTPSTCATKCNVSVDAMIQMVVVYDRVNETFLYPTSSYQARADANGWVIDRVDGEGEGWYGLLNDGVTFTPFWNTTGGNNTANTLFDQPGGWPNNIFFFAVDAAVCFKSDTCTNKILGYYFWSYTVDNNANASTFITAPAWQDLNVEFQNALASWNSWAPSSGFEGGAPPLDTNTLSHAVVFPAFSDL